MNSCFVSSLQMYSIFVTLDFTAIEIGVKFLLPTTVYNRKPKQCVLREFFVGKYETKCMYMYMMIFIVKLTNVDW